MFKNDEQRKGRQTEIEAAKTAAEKAEAWACSGR
jgi:hypothetical protein